MINNQQQQSKNLCLNEEVVHLVDCVDSIEEKLNTDYGEAQAMQDMIKEIYDEVSNSERLSDKMKENLKHVQEYVERYKNK